MVLICHSFHFHTAGEFLFHDRLFKFAFMLAVNYYLLPTGKQDHVKIRSRFNSQCYIMKKKCDIIKYELIFLMNILKVFEMGTRKFIMRIRT